MLEDATFKLVERFSEEFKFHLTYYAGDVSIIFS